MWNRLKSDTRTNVQERVAMVGPVKTLVEMVAPATCVQTRERDTRNERGKRVGPEV